MANTILDSAVVSKMPALKAPPSKLKSIARMRNKRIWSDNQKRKAHTENTSEMNHDAVVDEASIVLVDNDPSSRHTMRTLSRELNFNIYSASSFTQALRTFDIRPNIGVVVLRVTHNPDEFEKMLRLLKDRYPRVSIIALADIENVGWVIDLVTQGYVFRYLSEPFNKSDFEKVILSAQKRHKMLDKIEDLRGQIDTNEMSSISKLKLLFSKTA